MLKKMELREKLKNISLVDANYSKTVINRLQNLIKDKIVCTYIPLENEININMHLKGQSVLSTTCIKDGEIKICIYEEPFEKNSFNVYQPINLKIIDKIDIFLVPGVGFDKKGTRLGKGSGFYDQLLADHLNSTFIGITDRNHIVEEIPFENHDIQMHSLLTHDEFIDINL
jgi:5,10-methenyltetrahydrofolate synthetase